MYDRANLAAKHCKGNYIRNYAFYTRQMSQEIEKEQRIVNSMKSALENHEFVVFYQPKYGSAIIRSQETSGTGNDFTGRVYTGI